jgi:hypothetical protein
MKGEDMVETIIFIFSGERRAPFPGESFWKEGELYICVERQVLSTGSVEIVARPARG